MYHGMTFQTIPASGGTAVQKNTWTDWHLIPSERPSVATPESKEKLVEIPGRNGLLDITEYLTGSTVFGNRTGSWDFYVMHEYWQNWVETYSTIANFIHGKKLKVTLEDDPNYYYEGRFKVNWSTQKDYSKITIEYTIDPFKHPYSINGTDSL